MDRPETILVVDDEPLLRTVLRDFLEGLGYFVVEAENGQEGLNHCILEPPDLVLLDIKMPGMNGFEVCREIKSHLETRDTPIIYLSAAQEGRDLQEVFASGGADHVAKPFRFEELKARIGSQLELRRQKKQIEEDNGRLQEALTEVRKEEILLIDLNERLRQSVAIKSHFIAHMRNEIYDPLSAILALAEEINDPLNGIERSKSLGNRIKAEAFNLDFQFRNIFCAAELEAGDASPSISKVDLKSVFLDTVEAHGASASEKAQALEVILPKGMEPVFTDAAKLRIILANLVANAIEFSPNGGSIELRAREAGDSLLIEVKDHGGGLSETDISVIFERFRQLDVGHDRAHKGQGLGLAVVKALVELLDGQISVESEPGHGSTFTCRLPILPRTNDPDSFAFDGNLFIFDEPREL